MLVEYDTEFPFFSKASLSPQHVVTDEERVVIGRNTAPVPSPNTSQVHTPTMSHTQAQLKKMRERWRNKVTLARASNRLSAAGLAAERQEEEVWWLPCLNITCLSKLSFTATCISGRVCWAKTKWYFCVPPRRPAYSYLILLLPASDNSGEFQSREACVGGGGGRGWEFHCYLACSRI